MSDNKQAIGEEDLFEKMEVPFAKSKEKAWDELLSKIEEGGTKATSKVVSMPTRSKSVTMTYAIAASLTLVISIAVFCHFYTTSIYVDSGKQLICNLPDGSSIELNSGSSIKYKPYWWTFEREVSFEGEGFFKVEKGERFTVLSALGQTEVLGTSFNIYSRGDKYEVYCKTGKVAVYSNVSGKKVELTPKMFATVNETHIGLGTEVEAGDAMGWSMNVFSFKSDLLSDVFSEIERQYAVTIEVAPLIKAKRYTAFYKKPENVEDLLTLICQTFGLKFELKSKKTYRVY